MLDPLVGREAMRLRAASVVAVTTGLINDLYATTEGYRRNSGSFISDGFANGMEVTAIGYNANNNATTTGKMIKGQVLAGLLPIDGGLDPQTVVAGRKITVGIPKDQRWENAESNPNQPAPGIRPYIGDQWGDTTFRFVAGPKQGGHIEEEGVYYITWYGIANIGIPALYRPIAAIKALFTPGTQVTAGSLFIRVRVEGPRTGQLKRLANGMAYIQLAIPWRCASINQVAA
jgi:hypothetical protein